MSNINRRDLIKGVALGVGAAMLPNAAQPRLTQAAVDGVGTVAGTADLVPTPQIEMGEAEWFSPCVFDSEVSYKNDVYDVGALDGRPILGMSRIEGRFSMYLEDAVQADVINRFMDKREIVKLDLAQGPFNYRMDAVVTNVTIEARPQDFITAEVEFVATSMEVIENENQIGSSGQATKRPITT